MRFRSVHIASLFVAPLACTVLLLSATEARAEPASQRAHATQPDAQRPAGLTTWPARFSPRAMLPVARGARPARAPHSAPAAPTPPRATRPQASTAQPSAAQPNLVALEIRELRAGAATEIERFSLSLGGDGSSQLETRVGDVEYQIGVRRDGAGALAPLGFDIRKRQRGPRASTSEAQIRASVKMLAGKSVVIATIDRADGSRTEVLAQIK